MEDVRYYRVDPESKTHAILERLQAARECGYQNRWDWLCQKFPAAKEPQAGWQLVLWSSAFGGGRWGVKAPEGTPCPPDWKVEKNSGGWIPRHSTKGGKALHAEMQLPEYHTPGPAEMGDAIGSKAVFVGFSCCTIGVQRARNGVWLLTLRKGHKIPKGVTRISDIEAEQLLAMPRSRKKKAVL